MLIVCPSCATSYMIDPATVAPAGRTVRCARCRGTWFASPPPPGETVDAFVDGVIAEAEAERHPPAAEAPRPDPMAAWRDDPPQTAEAEFGGPTQVPPAPPFPAPMHEPEVRAAEPAFEAHDRAPDEPPATIEHAPSLVPADEHAPLPEPSATAPDEDAENYSARRRRMQSKRQKDRRSSRWTAVVLLLFAFNVAVVGARKEVVRYLPQTASLFAAIGLPVNLRQLAFEHVRIVREKFEGATILAVEGKIVSKANVAVPVPRLRFAARSKAGQEIYVWTARPERSILPPGESIDFRSSLAKPPGNAVDVVVRFFNEQDAAGG